jgi:hypothetical protein
MLRLDEQRLADRSPRAIFRCLVFMRAEGRAAAPVGCSAVAAMSPHSAHGADCRKGLRER